MPAHRKHSTPEPSSYVARLRNDGDEVEIARIALSSVLMEVLSVRAVREGDLIRYRIQDDHDFGDLCCPDKVSTDALTLDEVVDFIDGIHQFDRGVDLGPYYIAVRELNIYYGGSTIDEMEHFASVSSGFYPEIFHVFKQKTEDWANRKRRELWETCEDCGVECDPDDDHECAPMRARWDAEEAEEQRVEELCTPFADEIESAVADWRAVDRGSGAAGLGYAASKVRAQTLEGFLRKHIADHGRMPTGSHTLQYRFISKDTLTFLVDLDTLHDRAEGVRAQDRLRNPSGNPR